MQLQHEEDIRQYIEARLKQKGVAFEREVACGNGIRADLVTADTVIEIKRRLNRGALYQAYGQGVAYQKLLKKPKLLIIGLAPSSESKYQEAQRIAENVRTESVEIVFIDRDPRWGLAAASIGGAVPNFTAKSTKSTAKSTARLPFEPVAASIVGTVATEVAEKVVEKAAEKIAEKSAQASEPNAKPAGAVLPESPPKAPSPPPPAAKPSRSPLNDFWILLLIILVFLWIRTYFWRSQPSGPAWVDSPAAPSLKKPLSPQPLSPQPAVPRPPNRGS